MCQIADPTRCGKYAVTVQTILRFPDNRLRATAQRVVVFDEDLCLLATDLLDTLRAEPQAFRTDYFAAYYRHVKNSLNQALAGDPSGDNYPDPKEHCDICRWRLQCNSKRRNDDHLCLVAGITRIDINELKQQNILTTADPGAVLIPLPWLRQWRKSICRSPCWSG
jgi:hypothetical protein